MSPSFEFGDTFKLTSIRSLERESSENVWRTKFETSPIDISAGKKILRVCFVFVFSRRIGISFGLNICKISSDGFPFSLFAFLQKSVWLIFFYTSICYVGGNICLRYLLNNWSIYLVYKYRHLIGRRFILQTVK